MPRPTSSQLSAAVKAPARQPQPKPYAWSREWAWNEVGGITQVLQLCRRYCCSLSPATGGLTAVCCTHRTLVIECHRWHGWEIWRSHCWQCTPGALCG